MVLEFPWTRILGAARVSVEVADEFVAMGHSVEKFDLFDAFPRRNKLSIYFETSRFPRRAIDYVRANAHRFDIIQAELGNLPVSKEQLGFKGLLVARSNGLQHFYSAYTQAEGERKRKLGIREGTFVGNTLRALNAHMEQEVSMVDKSMKAADAIVLINDDERRYVAETLGHGSKAVLFHNGLSNLRFAEFAAHHVDARQRLAQQAVVFIGYWSERKGAQDFPNLVRQVRQARPQAKFVFLGTGIDQSQLRELFAPEDREAISGTHKFASSELPELLRQATIGILPSYIEGFGIGVLEALAAGVPTIAYDVPGPREMLKQFDVPMMTPVGDVAAAAGRLVSLLSLSVEEYAALSTRAIAIASNFRWEDIAARMMAHYQAIMPKS